MDFIRVVMLYSGEDFCCFPLLQFHERVVGADGVHRLHADLFYGAVLGRADALLHFHSFNDADFLADGYGVAGADQDADYTAGHWGADYVAVGGGGVDAAGRGRDQYAGRLGAAAARPGGRGRGQTFDFHLKGLAVHRYRDRRTAQVAHFYGVPAAADADAEPG